MPTIAGPIPRTGGSRRSRRRGTSSLLDDRRDDRDDDEVGDEGRCPAVDPVFGNEALLVSGVEPEPGERRAEGDDRDEPGDGVSRRPRATTAAARSPISVRSSGRTSTMTIAPMMP